jgi:hypothetical protein
VTIEKFVSLLRRQIKHQQAWKRKNRGLPLVLILVLVLVLILVLGAT